MSQYAGAALVGIRQDLLVESQVAGLGHVCRDGIEEPQAIIRPVFLVGGWGSPAGVVIEGFDDR